jgi:serine/threonine protein kinase
MAGVDEFLRNLQTSGLLTPEQWKIVRREAAGGPADGAPGHDSAIDAATPAAPTPAELAQTLVRQGFITPWQAEMLLQGKKAFFIGKYRLLDCIGSGGMGAVFTALHRELGRIVAIKIMSAEVVKDRRAVARFRREVQSVAALDHPHIVTAYDAGSAGGLHYLVMEYIEGHDLGWLVKQNGPLPVEWSCECIRQAAQGLQYAHEKGMVHRDIKPTNLLVAKDRESNRPLVKILDLGLARGSGMRGGSGALTQIGQFLGTPDYISPEQGQDTRLADIRSDIFSLGCTFFRMLTAQLPFPGESVAEKLAARETIDAPRISTLRSEVPAELDIVVARMLARDPNSRYQTPREVAQALAPFTRRVAPLPAPSPAGTPVRRPGRLPGEDTRLEEFFKSLATAEEESLSVSGIATRLRRVSPRIWLVVASLTLILVAGIIAWERSSVATMVVDWPLNERQGSELRVNWRLVKLSAERQLAVRGRPGTWDFRIAREGYETIEKTVTLHRGARLEITPEWQPTPRTLRRLQVKELETRVATALGSEPSSPTNVAVRGEVSAFLRDYPGSQEAQAVRKLAARLLWPLDLLDGTRVTDDLWQPPAGDPLEEPPLKPVSVLGDGRLKFWNTVTAMAATDDGRLLAGASLDGTVQVFEQADAIATAVLVFRPRTFAGTVPSKAVQPNDRTQLIRSRVGRPRLHRPFGVHLRGSAP